MKSQSTLRKISIHNKPWRVDVDGVRLFLHLTPKASRDVVGGVFESTDGVVLKVRVRALPDKGKANQAVVKLLANWLGVSKTSLKLLSGFRSRQKTIKIFGEKSEIVELLETRIK